MGYMKERLKHYPSSQIHYLAPGDFTLMHRDSWHHLQGYPELDTDGTSIHIDTILLQTAILSGLSQGIFDWPARIYHQEHSRGEQKLSQKGEELFRQSIMEGKMVMINDDSWGLKNYTLKEYTIG